MDAVRLLVYIGGPIDLSSDDPDARHVALFDALIDADATAIVWCPFCDQRQRPMGAAERIAHNGTFLDSADWAVFVWDIARQPSMGSTIELWVRTGVGRDSIVVGPRPPGLYADSLHGRGVVWVDTIADAVRRISAG